AALPAAAKAAALPAAAKAAALPTPEAAIALAPLVAVALAHLHRRFHLVRLHAHGEEADDVAGKTHAALHLVDRRGRTIDIHQRIVGLAVLLDLEGNGLDAPVFGLADPAAALFDDLGVFLHQRFDLRLGDVLARQEDMLI